MVAARIAQDLTMAVVGSPSYLERVPAIEKPQDLTSLNCITLRLPTRDSLLQWELRRGKRQVQVRPSGQLTFNSVIPIVDAALAGFGLAYIPKYMADPHVAAGRLRWVLEEWFPTYEGLHVFYRSRKKSLKAVELVVETLKAGYKGS
jgi:DNA-binding transcriptional LysR family regulator